MELYHLHLKGIRDDKWKEKKEIIIDNTFVNRLGKKINNFNDCTDNKSLKDVTDTLNFLVECSGYSKFSKMPLYLILDFLLDNELDSNMQKIILSEVKNMAFQAAIFKRETALEQFRKDNKPELPSRQHCIYATNESGVKYWEDRLTDSDIEVFRIDALDNVFKTSEIFIPDESNNYEEMYNNSFRYWNPKFKNISDESSEYLVKGKVKILEKVSEICR